ncbi:hypothetical protein GC163_03405 [bacterium]|nr:hypothetical protein [bacterium]
MSASTFDTTVAHRWFAIECNNAAWDLIEAPSLSPEEELRMLDLAHAAHWHWGQVGTAINQQRALCLLSTAYLWVRDPAAAARYARACQQITESQPDGLTPFDRAAALGCESAAARRLKDSAAITLTSDFQTLCDTLDDSAEQALLTQLYGGQ